jgi:phosphopantetheine--protein transferase-like protein
MIVGVGVDVLLIDRIRRATSDMSDCFITETYTKMELKQAEERSDPALHLATRFAGKEAIYKSLGGTSRQISLSQIEILNDSEGAPHVILHGEAQDTAQKKEVSNILISLSYDTGYAVAFAIAQRELGLKSNNRI